MDKLLDVQPVEGVNAPQGMLCAHIVVDAETLNDDAELVQAVVDFVNGVHERAWLVPDEYPAEALWSYHADYYLAQVNNGGHGQFAHNSRLLPRTLRDCRLGLHAMGARDNLAIFDAFLAIMADKDGLGEVSHRVHHIIDAGGFGDGDPDIEDLDTRFFALGDTITHCNASWLRGLPCLKALPADELKAEFEKLAADNPRRQARIDAAAAARAKFESEDATYSAAHACAVQEGATFERLTAGNPIGGGNIEWGAITSAGFRWLGVIEGSHAEWRDDKRALKALYFYETKTAYPAGSGDGAVRAEIMRRKKKSAPTDWDAQFKFFLRPLANLTLAATDGGDGKAVSALVNGLEHAKSLQRLSRSVSGQFGYGREHAQFRMLVAYLLWDLSVRQIRRANANVLGDDYMRVAMMAAAGAISAAGATAVRLPRVDQIDALSRESEADFKREQQNVWLQLYEIREWWKKHLWRIARAAGERKSDAGFFLRPPSFKLAGELVFAKGQETPGADLARRLDYFNSEYGRAPKLAFDIDKTARATLGMFHADSESIALSAAVRMFESIETNPKAMPPFEPAYYLARPEQMKSTAKAPLIGVLAVANAHDPNGNGAMGVDFDRRGDRKPIKK